MVRGKPTSLAYATSKSPVGPFEYKGIIVDNDGCDPESAIFFNVDGTIQEAPMTSQGTGRPYGINETIAAYRAGRLSGGVYIAPLKNGIEGLTGIMDSDEAIFRYVEWEKPVNKISVSGTGSGEINIYLDNNKEPSGSIILENGYIISSTFKGIPGKHEIKLKFNNINKLEVYSLIFQLVNN
jgi:arabinoxylan arabinofuranohydrolase